MLLLAAASPLLAQATRTEHDSLGGRKNPAEADWGVQTSRAMETFPFNTHKLAEFPTFIAAYGRPWGSPGTPFCSSYDQGLGVEVLAHG